MINNYFEKNDKIEIYLATILAIISGLIFLKFPIGYSALFFLVLLFIIIYNKTIILKNKAIYLGAFWIAYSIRSTIFSDISILKGIFYPIYLLMILNSFWSISSNNYLENKVFPKVTVAWLLFMSVMCIGIINMDYITDLNIYKSLFIFTIPLISFFQLPSQDSNKVFLWFQKWVSIILIFWVILYNIMIGKFTYRGGIDVNQNFVSTIIAIGLLSMLFGIFSNEEYKIKIFSKNNFYIFCLFAGVYSLLILGSRGVTIAFTISSLILFLFYFENFKKKKLLVFLVLLCSFILFCLPGSENLFERFTGSDLASLNGRTFLWVNSLEHFFHNNIFKILFGEGVGSSRLIISNIDPALGSTHNGYIEFLIDFGIMGLFVFLVFFIIGLRSNYRMGNSFCPFGIALICFLFIINMSATQDSFVFWICLGQVLAIGGIEDASKS